MRSSLRVVWRRAAAPLVALFCVACIPDFGALSIVDDAGADAASAPRDAGADASARTDAGLDAGVTAIDAGADAGTEPDAGDVFVPTAVDVECPLAWSVIPETGAPTACEGRGVFPVASPLSTRGLALARARDGAITVAYNELEDFDFGRIATVRFNEDAPLSAAFGPTIEPESTFGDVVGWDLALATGPGDRHHLAYWLRSDFGHEVRYRTLDDDLFGPVETIASGVGPSGVVDVTIDSASRAVVAWHDDQAGVNVVRRRLADETWGTAVTLRTDGDPRMDGDGAIALARGPSEQLHAVYQWIVSLAASAPSYSRANSATWTTARTLDNAAIANRASGVGADITLVGDEVVVAYLDWQAGFGEVRLARFTGMPDSPVVTSHLPDIVIDELPGKHPIVIATDERGWLHLLVADAGSVETILLYQRQTRVGGELRWIEDEITRIASTPEYVYVDMLIGPGRRPHIVYWDPSRGVFYATVRPQPLL